MVTFTFPQFIELDHLLLVSSCQPNFAWLGKQFFVYDFLIFTRWACLFLFLLSYG